MSIPEKRLFDLALGDDEPPPMVLDLDGIAASGERRQHRRRFLSVGAAAGSVLILAGVLAVSTSHARPNSANSMPGAKATQVPATTAADPSSENTTMETSLPTVSSDTISVAVETVPSLEAPSNSQNAYCYRTADLNSTDLTQNVALTMVDGEVAGMAVEICKEAWSENRYSWRSPGEPVPAALIACVIPAPRGEGGTVVAVFPGTPQTCTEMGVPVAQI